MTTDKREGYVRYDRVPSLDKRIAHGDDFAGDAWVRWTAVGANPNSASPTVEPQAGESREEMLSRNWGETMVLLLQTQAELASARETIEKLRLDAERLDWEYAALRTQP